MATQKTIARALGISQPAVGAVLGKHSDKSKISVSPAVRELILAKAKELGYRPNAFAQALHGVRAKTIGMIHYDSIFSTSVEQKTFIAREVFNAGYRLNTIAATVINVTEPETMSNLVDHLIDMQVDGVILSFVPGLMPPEQIARLSKRNIPVVSIRGTIFPGISYFSIDLEQGTALLTKHLLRLGYRRLMLFRHDLASEPNVPWVSSEAPRVEGFSKTIKEAGGVIVDLGDRHIGDPAPSLPPLAAEIPCGYICYLQPDLPNYRQSTSLSTVFSEPYQTGYQRLSHCLDLDIDVDAFLFANDLQTLGAIKAALSRNLRIPEHFGVTGFAGNEMGQYHTPAITSVALPTELMVSRAIRHLLNSIKKKENGDFKPPTDDEQIELYPCHLLTGATTCIQPCMS